MAGTLVASQKTACLACRKRKIKCDKLYPCTACSQSGIQCGFMTTNRTKSRSKVLQKLRKAPVEEQIEMNRQTVALQQTPSGLDLKLLSPMLLFHCTKAFFALCYPINIIFTVSQFNGMITNYAESARKYSLVAALCAVAVYSCDDPAVFETESSKTTAVYLSARLIRASLHARSMYDYVADLSFESVLRSFYLSIATFQQQEDNKGWYYLRESCTIMQSAGYHKEEIYHTGQIADDDLYRMRLTYYLISISERANSIHRSLPVTMDHSIAFPLMDTNDPIQRGFTFLHELFAPFDKTYASYRDSGSLDYMQNPDDFVLDLHRRVTVACPPYTFFKSFHKKFPDSMVADLLVTKQWLLIKIYHLTLKYSLLAYLPQQADLGLLYPIKVARELVDIMEHLGGQAFEVHGSSMLEKFYDIATTLADLVSVVPIGSTSPVSYTSNTTTSESTGFGPQDLLQMLVRLVSELRKEHNIYLPRLIDKVHRCIALENNRTGSNSRQQFYDTVNYQFEDLFNIHISNEPSGYNTPQ